MLVTTTKITFNKADILNRAEMKNKLVNHQKINH